MLIDIFYSRICIQSICQEGGAPPYARTSLLATPPSGGAPPQRPPRKTKTIIYSHFSNICYKINEDINEK